MTIDVTWQDFSIFNKWDRKTDPGWIIDRTTNRKYMPDPRLLVSFKCFLLTVGTPVLHSVVGVGNVLARTVRVVSFAHFWMKKDREKGGVYSLKGRCCDLGEDLLRIVATPVGIVALELSAIFGIFSPYNGRKLYASFERLLYGGCVLAPCFQPGAVKHLFETKVPGGKI